MEIFEEVSRLLDKRRYRLRLVYWSLPAGNSLGERSELADQRMDDYRAVLYDRNDGINRNLALIQQYFGDEARFEFDNVIGIHLIELGRAVEDVWNGTSVLDPPQKAELEERLQLLSELIYHYNIALLQSIRANSIGTGRTRRGRRSFLGDRPRSDLDMAEPDVFERPEHVRAAFNRESLLPHAPASPTYLPHGSARPVSGTGRADPME